MQMSFDRTPKYWFPAKRYGWGWGIPSAWQGSVVLITYLVLVFGGIPFVRASQGSLLYTAYVLVLTVGLVAICWLKGEPPRWRWGGRDV
jgi:lipoprotein signal peptidase